MNLRQLAEQDLSFIVEDGATGFGWPITVTDPAGAVGLLTGFSSDISHMIDPETGQAVSGRAASVALRISSLAGEGLGFPVGVSDSAVKPWIIEFDDIGGSAHKFKVAKSFPDRAIGLVTCQLEIYAP